jgi:hypothetical protein
MDKIQNQTVSARPVEELAAEWERQRTAVYRLHERDISHLVESSWHISVVAAYLGNLIQRIAGAYIPTETDLERDAEGYDRWIRHEFKRVWELEPDDLFTQEG